MILQLHSTLWAKRYGITRRDVCLGMRVEVCRRHNESIFGRQANRVAKIQPLVLQVQWSTSICKLPGHCDTADFHELLQNDPSTDAPAKVFELPDGRAPLQRNI